jgi:hypothetical protein
MKKNLLWMLAAILTCGAMFTSCASNEDSPVQPEPPVLPDQAAMFVQNVLADGRYTPGVMTSAEGKLYYLCLHVADVEEAKAEFLKLLPEGVAETAFEQPVQALYSEMTGYKLYDLQNDETDIITFEVITERMISMMGYAWVELSRDLQEALQANVIIYMPEADNDDLNNIIKSFSNIMSMCQLDQEDPSHIICTMPSKEVYFNLAPAFITTKMMLTSVSTEEGNQVMTVTDNDGNSYGKLTLVPNANTSNGAQLQYLLDEDLQANFQEKSGMKFPIAKMSFFVTEAEEPAAE